MLSNGEMSFSQPDQSICDDYVFGPIPDEGEDSHDEAAEEIDAVNDETFGNDLQTSSNSELEDYAAQTACLRLDDGEAWDSPSCSKPPAPDASNVPLPYFDIFGTPTFSTFGSETMAKIDSLWSQSSHNVYDLWGEQSISHPTDSCSSDLPRLQDVVADRLTTSSCVFPPTHEISQQFSGTPETNYPVQQCSSILPPMPHGSTLHDLEREHLKSATTIGRTSTANSIPLAVNVVDVERRFIESGGIVSAARNRRSTTRTHQQTPQIRTMNKMRQGTSAAVSPAYGGVSSVQLPPLLPPVHPMMLPLVPVWLEHLTGRTRYLPPGCPPVPPLLRLLYNTVKMFEFVNFLNLLWDPMVVMDMLRTAPGGSVPPVYPPPTKAFERRSQWPRKPPGMPSGRTIEDLAFDQFAGYMSCKEREWLVKIQVLQCQGTGVPYDDDYYYTNWRAKQIARGLKPKLVNSVPDVLTDKVNKEHERRLRHINGSRSQFDLTKESKDLVPLSVKFAGSLGLPSRSSTNNPRHLISVEPSVESADDDASQRAGKQRKLRTLLLRLESALSLLIECEDIRVRMNSGQNGEVLLSDISRRIDVVYVDLMTEDLLKVLQIGKGRSVVARAISVGVPDDVIRIVLKLFSVMSACPKKCLDDISCDIVPSMFNGLMDLNREQLVTLSSKLDIAAIKENIEGKNTFCRDSLLSTLLACAKRKAVSKNLVHWLCSSPGDIDFINGWSYPLSKWLELLSGIQDSDVQMLSEWLLLLSDEPLFNSLAKLLANALLHK